MCRLGRKSLRNTSYTSCRCRRDTDRCGQCVDTSSIPQVLSECAACQINLHQCAAGSENRAWRRFAAWMDRAESFFDLVVDSGLGELGGYADGVLQGVRIRRPMANDAHALDPE